ncbi:MAG: arylamine N-acetyltransferase [Casimicrobiaceae bacterium]
MPSFDLHAYLDRIGWRDLVGVDLPTLTGLLRGHMAAIPFENFDVLLHRPIRLDIDSLQHKLVGAHRGGYCFEHATLFAAALEAIGFAPVRHAARVTLMKPRETAARTHMFVTVPLADGNFVADPGFGALAARMPMPLVDGAEVVADGNTHWMQRDADGWTLRALDDGGPVDCWTSTMAREYPVDFDLGNHFTSTGPGSSFVERMLLRAITPNGSVSLMNRDVTIREGGAIRRTQLQDRKALRALVGERFGFDLPELEALRVPSIPEWK